MTVTITHHPHQGPEESRCRYCHLFCAWKFATSPAAHCFPLIFLAEQSLARFHRVTSVRAMLHASCTESHIITLIFISTPRRVFATCSLKLKRNIGN